MKKTMTLLMVGLMLLTASCGQQTRQQIAEIIGRARMKKIEKDINSRIRDMVVPKLKNPDSYQPISTDMSIVTSDMVIYDSQAFLALRDLNRAIEDFNENYANDTTSQEARQELDAIQAMSDVLLDKINAINRRPIEFGAIDAYHQFYADDRPGHQAKKGYHFIIHKDNRITLLCDHDEFQQVKAFTRQLLNEPPYIAH